MPLRRQECKRCGFRFRVLELEVTAAAACPACGSLETRRLLPHIAVQFKGTGYYKTDHARSGAKARTTAETNEPIAATAGSDRSDNTQSAA
jgi:putative FmdB family regulatory protein